MARKAHDNKPPEGVQPVPYAVFLMQSADLGHGPPVDLITEALMCLTRHRLGLPDNPYEALGRLTL